MNVTFNTKQFSAIQKSRGNSSNENHDFNINKKDYIIYEKTEDMIYSGGSGNGMSFTVKYAKDSSPENPRVIAKGIDEKGKEFELTFNINDIDITNASKVEMIALENHLKLDKGKGLSTLPMKTSRMGLNDKSNFINMFEDSIKEQITLGQYDIAMRYKTNLKFICEFIKKN